MSLKDLLNKQTHDELVKESLLLYDYIDGLEVRVDNRDEKIAVLNEAIEGMSADSCGIGWAELILGAMAGALTVALVD